MKKKILIADKDASLKDAFRIIFAEDKYDILYAASAKDVEKVAATEFPEVYIVNVNLLKSSGIEVYRKLQKDKLLDSARFFFMKDENDTTELLGFEAEGVIEKPINFFKVHERIAKDEDVILLADEVVETEEAVVREPAVKAPVVRAPAVSEAVAKEAAVRDAALKEAAVKEDIAVKVGMGEGLVREFGTRAAVTTEDMGPALEVELRKALGVTMEEMVPRLVDRLTPVLSSFVEDYTRRVLYEIAEKVIREEIDKLLKESTT
jgi:response regulator RpfG family c-di-GMP phosphodiesterase